MAKVKTWRMLSREGGRYRCPIGKFESMLAAVTGLSLAQVTALLFLFITMGAICLDAAYGK